MMKIDRTSRGAFAEWWWTADKALFALITVLIVSGVLLSMAASPAVAERINLPPFHFVSRQIVFAVLAFTVVLAVSMLTPKDVRRLAALGFVGGLVLMGLALLIGPEIKGAHRWLDFGPLSLQPSEFTKPAFVVLTAVVLAAWRRSGHPAGLIAAFAIYAMFAGMLVLQPDFGQAILVSATFGALLFFAGLRLRIMAILAGVGAAAVAVAYFSLHHVKARIDRFIFPDSGDTFQVDRAMDAFRAGGLTGVGPGEGTYKSTLPDAHTDFVLAVAGEEFGLAICLALVALFLVLILRALWRSAQISDPFSQIAAAGLAVMLGLQALINMMVNLQMLPAKGMTLPFVSYGGSSIIALAMTAGFLIALTRKRPGARRRRPAG